MSSVRASKIMNLVSNEEINQNCEITVDENFGNESPIQIEGESVGWKTMFGQFFIESTISIDYSFIPSVTEVINDSDAMLPSILAPIHNESPTALKDSESCVEAFLHESTDVIELSLDITSIMPSPDNDF